MVTRFIKDEGESSIDNITDVDVDIVGRGFLILLFYEGPLILLSLSFLTFFQYFLGTPLFEKILKTHCLQFYKGGVPTVMGRSLSHHPAKFVCLSYCGWGEIMVLVCQMILQDNQSIQ